MPKRFTETAKWSDKWFAKLSIEHKLFWAYLCDTCDQAGIWDEPEMQAKARMGMPDFDFQAALKAFGERIEVLPNGAWWIVKFINFQNPKGLVPGSNYHKPVFASLEKHGIEVSRVAQDLTKSRPSLPDKDLDKDMGKSKEVPSRDWRSNADFVRFWEAWPRSCRKGVPTEAYEAWLKCEVPPPIDKVLETLAWKKKDPLWTNRDDKGADFILAPKRWIGKGGWNEENPQAHKNNFKHIVRQKPEDDGPMPF